MLFPVLDVNIVLSAMDIPVIARDVNSQCVFVLEVLIPMEQLVFKAQLSY